MHDIQFRVSQAPSACLLLWLATLSLAIPVLAISINWARENPLTTGTKQINAACKAMSECIKHLKVAFPYKYAYMPIRTNSRNRMDA